VPQVKSVPAGPGDPIARLCFRSSSLDSTASFYAQIFGLREVARSETELCLRYPIEDETTNGNPTTLVFRAPEIASTPKAQDPHRTTEDVASETNVLPGFDHLVIGVDDVRTAGGRRSSGKLRSRTHVAQGTVRNTCC